RLGERVVDRLELGGGERGRPVEKRLELGAWDEPVTDPNHVRRGQRRGGLLVGLVLLGGRLGRRLRLLVVIEGGGLPRWNRVPALAPLTPGAMTLIRCRGGARGVVGRGWIFGRAPLEVRLQVL